MKKTSYKKALNKVAKSGMFVSVRNGDTHGYVFIVNGLLKKEGKAYVVRSGTSYVSFNDCKMMARPENSILPCIWV